MRFAALYFVAVRVVARGLTVEGWFEPRLWLDEDGEGEFETVQSKAAPAGGGDVYATAARRWFLPAGAEIRVAVSSFDGAAARPFAIESGSICR